MKTKFVLLFVAMLCIGSCYAERRQVTFEVPTLKGMTDTKAIEDILFYEPGIIDFGFNLEKGELEIIYDDKKKTQDEVLAFVNSRIGKAALPQYKPCCPSHAPKTEGTAPTCAAKAQGCSGNHQH